jgi:hypothetical protein
VDDSGQQPVVVWNDEPPRSTWIQQLYLAERLQPTPALIPESIDERMAMFGYCNEHVGTRVRLVKASSTAASLHFQL